MAAGSAQDRPQPRAGRRSRLALLAVIGAMLLPGTWLRTTPPFERVQLLELAALEVSSPADLPAGLSIEGLWELDSPDPRFGGYSALLVQDGRARAFSDAGEQLAFTLPGHGSPAPRLAPLPPHPRLPPDRPDAEAVTSDPRTGQIWLAYERIHALRRLGPGSGDAITRPREMRGWPSNSGVEALARLADGRFLAFGERNRVGLLFPGDPLGSGAPARFDVAWPGTWRPVDAAALPDGRVLILMREVVPSWPPFRSMLMVGDPRAIEAGGVWRPTMLAPLDPALPGENYEGLAIVSQGDALTVWLMSDDNFSTFQRTLLAKLRWRR